MSEEIIKIDDETLEITTTNVRRRTIIELFEEKKHLQEDKKHAIADALRIQEHIDAINTKLLLLK